MGKFAISCPGASNYLLEPPVYGPWLGAVKATQFIGHAMTAAITLSVAWLLARLIDSLIKEYLVPLGRS